MIQSGTKPTPLDWNDYDFHRTFGTVTPSTLPREYDCDLGLTAPDQNMSGLGEDSFRGIPPLPMGCTGLTQADICSDEDGELYDPQYVYDKTLEIEGNAGNYNAPCDMRNSFKALTLYGVKKVGEKDNTEALKRIRAPYFNVRKTSDWFESIRSCLHLNSFKRRPVSIGLPWFREFSQVSSNGIVPDFFTGEPSEASWHNVKCSGWVVRNNKEYLKIKSWQGRGIGDKGFLYFSRPLVNKVLDIRGTCVMATKRAEKEDIQRVQFTLMEYVLFLMQQFLVQFANQK